MNDHTVKVIEAIQRTPSALTVRMEKPEGFTYRPGQWGYFTVRGDEGGISRTLSFSSSPTEPHLEFTKRLSKSDFSQTIKGLRPGDTVTFRGPAGNLVYEGGLEKVVFIAGGIGVTPLRSILKYAADRGMPGEKVFIYGNLNETETAFADEVRQWEQADPQLTVVHVLQEPGGDWNGFTGFINREVIERSVPDLSAQTFYVSGPPPMVRAVTGALDELGIAKDRVVTEELKGYETMI